MIREKVKDNRIKQIVDRKTLTNHEITLRIGSRIKGVPVSLSKPFISSKLFINLQKCEILKNLFYFLCRISCNSFKSDSIDF